MQAQQRRRRSRDAHGELDPAAPASAGRLAPASAGSSSRTFIARRKRQEFTNIFCWAWLKEDSLSAWSLKSVFTFYQVVKASLRQASDANKFLDIYYGDFDELAVALYDGKASQFFYASAPIRAILRYLVQQDEAICENCGASAKKKLEDVLVRCIKRFATQHPSFLKRNALRTYFTHRIFLKHQESAIATHQSFITHTLLVGTSTDLWRLFKPRALFVPGMPRNATRLLFGLT